MSDEAQAAESPKDPLLSLNSLDLGPAWARGETEKKKSGEAKGRRRRDDDRERDRGRGEGKRQDGRDRDRNRGRRDDGRGPRDGRREGRGDRGKRFQKGGRGRHDDDRHGSREREEVAPPEGFTAAVMPVEEGLDGLAKEILAGGRTYSVFDLAKLVLGARERFNVTFRSGKETGGLVRCKKDGSLWLSRKEALQHFWRADWRGDYYEEVVSETDPPRGNFQTVARCGISGEWLGPPNYHDYQPALMRLHRERFGNMSLDAYKRKIKMERGEEAVAAWLEKMSRRVTYRPTGGVVPEVEEETEDESAVVEESMERTGESAAPGDETEGSDETGE
ncbi:MAG: hypothetical protein QF706_11595, partial [Roseibacillus sp.]|nr:hypothetical protein [Roseibacillus sp.]